MTNDPATTTDAETAQPNPIPNSSSQPNPDTEALQKRALSEAQAGRWESAIDAWQQLEQQQPLNAQAADEAARLVVARARRRFGLDRNESSDVLDAPTSSGDTAVVTSRRHEVALKIVQGIPFPHLPTASQELNRNLLQQLEHAHRDLPSDADILLHLAKVYVEHDREYNAEQHLEKFMKIHEKAPRVQAALEEVRMFRLEQKIQAARIALSEEQTEQAQENLTRHLAEQDRLETRIFRERCQREPENAQLQLEMGRRLERGEKYMDAATYFSKVALNPHLGPTAAWEAGRCYEKLGEFPAALRYYRQAAEGARRPGHEASGTAALMAAAQLARRLKMNKLSARYLRQLLRISPGHSEALAWSRSWGLAENGEVPPAE